MKNETAAKKFDVIKRLSTAVAEVRGICEPEFVLLFGSFAYGTPHEGSDVDVLVVYPDNVDEELIARANSMFHEVFGKRLEIHSMRMSQLREGLLKRNWFLARIIESGIPIFSRDEWGKVVNEVRELMSQSENIFPLEWLERAEADIQLFEFALNRRLIPEAAYHLQQAVEKWLKAFLLHHGWELERTHDLDELLDEAIKYDESFERFRQMCHRVKYFIAARYPGFTSLPTTEEIEKLAIIANELGETVKQVVAKEQ